VLRALGYVRPARLASKGKEVIKSAPPTDRDIVAYEMDADGVMQNGKLEASAIKAVRIPGGDMAKKWLGSLTFAAKDWAGLHDFT
jgi:hypothetical protein